MGAIVRIIFPLIGYLCVGTVITVTAGYGYLRSNGSLNDERMFHILSLLHGIDMTEITETYEKGQGDVPPEEASFEQSQEQIQLAVLLRQGKRDDLKKLTNDFEHQYEKLATKGNRFENYKGEVEEYLKQRKAEAIDSGKVAVRSQLQILDPRKQTKVLIKRMIEEDQIDDVVLLLNGMSAKKRRDILRTFDSEEEIIILYDIQQQMLKGDPERTFIENKLQDIQEGKKQEK